MYQFHPDIFLQPWALVSLVSRLVGIRNSLLGISVCLIDISNLIKAGFLIFHLLPHGLFFHFSHLRKWHPHCHLDGSNSLLTGSLLLLIIVPLWSISPSTVSEISEKPKPVIFFPWVKPSWVVLYCIYNKIQIFIFAYKILLNLASLYLRLWPDFLPYSSCPLLSKPSIFIHWTLSFFLPISIYTGSSGSLHGWFLLVIQFSVWV